MPSNEAAKRRLEAVKAIVDKHSLYTTNYEFVVKSSSTLSRVLGDVHDLYTRGRTATWIEAIDEWCTLIKRNWTLAPEYALVYGAVQTMEKVL